MAAEYLSEIWTRKEIAGEIGSFYGKRKGYHYHITIARPYVGEDSVKRLVAEVCKNWQPIPYVLEGEGSFGKGIDYIPVISDSLLRFNNEFEEKLSGHVDFAKKLADEKILHIRVYPQSIMKPFPKKESIARFVTTLSNKRIVYSCEFGSGSILDRKETLVKVGA